MTTTSPLPSGSSSSVSSIPFSSAPSSSTHLPASLGLHDLWASPSSPAATASQSKHFPLTAGNAGLRHLGPATASAAYSLPSSPSSATSAKSSASTGRPTTATSSFFGPKDGSIWGGSGPSAAIYSGKSVGAAPFRSGAPPAGFEEPMTFLHEFTPKSSFEFQGQPPAASGSQSALFARSNSSVGLGMPPTSPQQQGLSRHQSVSGPMHSGIYAQQQQQQQQFRGPGFPLDEQFGLSASAELQCPAPSVGHSPQRIGTPLNASFDNSIESTMMLIGEPVGPSSAPSAGYQASFAHIKQPPQQPAQPGMHHAFQPHHQFQQQQLQAQKQAQTVPPQPQGASGLMRSGMRKDEFVAPPGPSPTTPSPSASLGSNGGLSSSVSSIGSVHGSQGSQGSQPHPARSASKKSGKPTTNTELYKTELCASFMNSGGNCPYGDKCQFAHGEKELKIVDRPPKWRSKPCQNWIKTGTCSYNDRCCFRHDGL